MPFVDTNGGALRAFLDDYRPNDSFSLPPDTRERLLECRRSPEGEHPAGTHARQIFNRLLIDLSWNSSRLEGNTYSLLEAERLLELGEPDAFRLRHRALVAEAVSVIVRNRMDKKAATALIRRVAAENLPLEEQVRFVEIVETELITLHDGSIVRFRMRPSEYEGWRET